MRIRAAECPDYILERDILLRTILIEPLVMLTTVLQWLILSIVTGALVGSGVSFFLIALFALTGQSIGIPLWAQMILLPVGGLANGLLLYYGYRVSKTELTDGALAAVHDQQGRMPLKTLLIKPVAAIITLASGGAAGKESPCSHIGASLASGFGQLLHVNTELHKRLTACGVSAGFAGVFGTPIAGPFTAWKCWLSAVFAMIFCCRPSLAALRPIRSASSGACPIRITTWPSWNSFPSGCSSRPSVSALFAAWLPVSTSTAST